MLGCKMNYNKILNAYKDFFIKDVIPEEKKRKYTCCYMPYECLIFKMDYSRDGTGRRSDRVEIFDR